MIHYIESWGHILIHFIIWGVPQIFKFMHQELLAKKKKKKFMYQIISNRINKQTNKKQNTCGKLQLYNKGGHYMMLCFLTDLSIVLSQNSRFITFKAKTCTTLNGFRYHWLSSGLRPGCVGDQKNPSFGTEWSHLTWWTVEECRNFPIPIRQDCTLYKIVIGKMGDWLCVVWNYDESFM